MRFLPALITSLSMLPALAGASTLAIHIPGKAEQAIDPAKVEGVPAEPIDTTLKGKAVHHECRSVFALLLALGATPEPLHGEALQDVVIAEGRDGYKVAFAVAELAPSLGNRVACVASDGEGWRLVVPGDRRPARWVRDLAGITLLRP